MKTTSLQELKKELQLLPPAEVLELCITLAKFKKENKELLGYLLFEANDKPLFTKGIKDAIDEEFSALRLQKNLYLVKKGLRKLLRMLNKYDKFIYDKPLTTELRIYFCRKLNHSGIPYHQSQRIVNLYEQQLKKIHTLISDFHEDLQQDYLREMEEL